MKSPTPIDKEIKLDPSKIIMSKTDAHGVLEYANDYFMEISGYEEFELMGQPHNIIRHPDMPKVIFKLMWERLNQGKNIYAVVKNLAKDGRYYWVLTNFETKYDDDNNIIAHYARRKAAPGNVIYEFEQLYKVLLSIEQKQNEEISEKYFYGMLEERNQTYDQFILSVLNTTPAALQKYFFGNEKNNKSKTNEKKSLLKKLFS